MANAPAGARTPAGSPGYELGRLGRALGEAGFAVIAGGGPGMMEAANRGAREAGATSVGLNIQLPFEQRLNPYVGVGMEFHYFFARKVMFVRYASAFVGLPGGSGRSTRSSRRSSSSRPTRCATFPVVLVATQYWGGPLEWLGATVADAGAIGSHDLDLLHVTDDVDAIVERMRAGARLQGVVP